MEYIVQWRKICNECGLAQLYGIHEDRPIRPERSRSERGEIRRHREVGRYLQACYRGGIPNAQHADKDIVVPAEVIGVNFLNFIMSSDSIEGISFMFDSS